ncbi:hypothetical protein E2C01_014118 [Portunus trituberculatus]|uniref:Uncharacterized protein n=1 Tax=Portunus trituberculatus TaxID=210409 RepID=A0A5B7DHZ0_PORTR|nr:hypothetical protein [Portunus trituberculatus]
MAVTLMAAERGTAHRQGRGAAERRRSNVYARWRVKARSGGGGRASCRLAKPSRVTIIIFLSHKGGSVSCTRITEAPTCHLGRAAGGHRVVSPYMASSVLGL